MKYITLLKIIKHLTVSSVSFRTFSVESLYTLRDGISGLLVTNYLMQHVILLFDLKT